MRAGLLHAADLRLPRIRPGNLARSRPGPHRPTTDAGRPAELLEPRADGVGRHRAGGLGLRAWCGRALAPGRGGPRRAAAQAAAFGGGLLALLIALVSPL